ncbi:hypothetical protein PF672P2_00045 [Parabacteroides phage PF672P2]|nr:hypothetical protein PF672P1_00005 [Parabacteroides phage PF672P1]WAX17182.1 hypothetical protein PF672P2_00045 [Parabacteroides phage PF672P2]
MGKYFGKSRYDVQPLLASKYQLTKNDWNRLTILWHIHGMRGDSEPENRSPANHYFLQGILEHLSIEWETWKYGITPVLADAIKNEFPQLMVEDKEFNIG